MPEKTQNSLKNKPTVAVSIVTWNSAAEIGECLAPLAGLPDNWEVWVVDNRSADETAALIKSRFDFVHLIENRDNKGFAAANNQVVAQTATDYVLFLNPDAAATVENLEKALTIIESNDKIGILGAKLFYADGSVQPTCYHFPTLSKNFVDALGLQRIYSPEKKIEKFAGEFFAHDEFRRVDWLKGAFMLARRAAIERVGGIPEDYFMFAEDMDFCWQIAQNGYEIRFTPDVSVVHKANKSAGQLPSEWRVERTTLSKYLFCFKNFGALGGRLIQLTDLLGVNYKIFRRRLKEKDSPKIQEWKMARREIFKSIFLSRARIVEKLHKR